MGRPPTILAFARSTSGFYFGGLLAGLNREVASQGGRLLIVQTIDANDEADLVVSLPRFDLPVGWDEVDGVVAVSLAAGPGLLERVRAAGKPVVLTHPVDGFDAPLALPNNHGAAAAAVEHLVAHGHRRIAFAGRLVQADMAERFEAYRSTLLAHGLPAGDELLLSTPDTMESGGDVAAAALAALPPDRRPTAVLAANDHTALGLLDGLNARGLRVPHDVAVVGFDDMEAGAFSTPALSSMTLQFDEVGALAGRLVLSAVAGDPAPAVQHTPGTVILRRRGSCGCAPGLLDGPTAATPPPVARRASSADASGTAPTRTGPEPTAAELTSLVKDALVHGLSGQDVELEEAQRALAVLEGPVRLGRPGPQDARVLVSVLERLAPRPELLHQAANAVSEHLQRTAVAPDGSLPPLVTALWHLQAAAFLRRAGGLESQLTEQFRIAAGLLHASSAQARDLSWLAGTHVRAGLLALWSGDPDDGRLEVAGVYDPDGVLGERVGAEHGVRTFPPSSLLELARPERREACFVVPVQGVGRQWGLFAVVGDIDPTASQAHYHYWARLLASAFEEEQLALAARRSEERYAHVARAANDGLWEVEPTSLRLTTTERFRDLLGVRRDERLSLQGWLDRVHPDDAEQVRAGLDRVMTSPERPVEVEFRVEDEHGWRWLLGRGLGVAGADGAVERIVGSLSDVDSRKQLEHQLRMGALYDAVTGLPNRRLFLERLAVTVAHARRRPDARYAVLFMDLDGFKLVNDSLGHLAGDDLLRVVAQRLRAELRVSDTAARFGGDEFAVLLVDTDPEEVLVIARRIQDRIAEPVSVAGHEVAVTTSTGVATSDSRYRDAEEVLRDADIAMYEAKGTRRGSASVFDPEMHARASARLQARAEVRTALAERQFVVHYQPIVALGPSQRPHLEALVRWEHPQRGLLLPGAFLPAMEDTAMIVELGHQVVDDVCAQLAAWAEVDFRPSVAVNVSHQEFWATDLVTTVAAALERHDVPAEQLVMEITESVVMEDAAAGRDVMSALRALGLRLHIDDFGTGQSSLAALRSFPVDAIKVDGSFIRELGLQEQTSQLVRIIVEIGEVLGVDVVAECVETSDQADRLRAMGCSYAQGWLFGRATPAEVVPALVAAIGSDLAAAR